MFKITNLNDEAKQSVKISVGNNKIVKLTFEYCPNQRCWWFDIECDDLKFYSYGHKLTNCPNIIREFQNLLPFGIGCNVLDNQEPWFQNDFITGRVSVYILDKEEVQEIGQVLYGKIW